MNRWRPVQSRGHPYAATAYMPVPDRPDPATAVPTPDVAPVAGEPEPQELRLAFAPLHKRAFGTSIGFAAAVLVFGITAFHLLVQPERPNLELLSHYFRGYEVSWKGGFIGAAWAFGVGFVAGWFFAFCRNLAVAASIFLTRTRAELKETAEFLDHI